MTANQYILTKDLNALDSGSTPDKLESAIELLSEARETIDHSTYETSNTDFHL